MRTPPSRLLLVFLLLGTVALAAQEPADVSAEAMSAVDRLPFRPIDAEFSTALDAIIAIADGPSQVHVYKPDTKELAAVNLQLSPKCLSISPDGLTAVVGHNGWISSVDLSTMTLLKTIAVPEVISEIVHAGNGYAYGFTPSFYDYIYSINLTTEAVTSSSGGRTPAAARLHPAGDRLYGADRNVSPDDIMRIDVSPQGPADFAYDSPYHGNYSFCGNVWISMDGLRLFTACGNVFRASNVPAEDMTFSGKLSEENLVTWASHSQSGNSVVVLPGFGQLPRKDNEVHYYTQDFLLYRGKATLPSFIVDNNTWEPRGRYVFFNAAGTKQYVIVQAAETSNLAPLDYGVVTIDCTNATVTPSPASMTMGAAAGSAQFTVTGSAGCGWKAISNDSWISTLSTGIGDGTVSFNVLANPSAASRTGTITIGSATFTVTQNAPVPASVIATATSASSINIAWSISGVVDHYEVWRSTAGGAYALVGSPAGTSYVDATVSADTAYLYKVRSVLAGDAGSTDFSKADYAHTYTFTDVPLLALTAVKTAHVTELRTVANAMRTAAGVSAVTFTDPSLGGVYVKAVHLTEVRDALNGARAALGMSSLSAPVVTAGNVIAAQHVVDLRTGAQ